jgi:hypothetical protein
MCKNSVPIMLGCCLFVMPILAGAQTTRKAGLWELTTTQTFQQSPFPTGAAGTRTTPVCLTQQQIDRYGAILPQIRSCHVTNVVKKTNGMTADMVCTGMMSGKATLQSDSTDGVHATGKVHFIGSMQVGSSSKPMEWTTLSSATFKGPDCGDVKPVPVPDQ